MQEVIARAEREKRETGKDKTRWSRMAERWWQFRDYMPGTMSAIAPLSRYIMCPRVTKRPIFEFVSTAIHPDGATMVFPLADDYSFGVLQSGIHFLWFRAKCSTLKADFRYTSDTVFDTFPWPQKPTRAQIKALAEAAVALRALRRETMRKLKYSLRDLYRTLEQPGDNPLRDAHARLDAAVRAAYGMPEDADPLAFLLELNLACAAKEKAGEKITPPGLPFPRGSRTSFSHKRKKSSQKRVDDAAEKKTGGLNPNGPLKCPRGVFAAGGKQGNEKRDFFGGSADFFCEARHLQLKRRRRELRDRKRGLKKQAPLISKVGTILQEHLADEIDQEETARRIRRICPNDKTARSLLDFFSSPPKKYCLPRPS